MAHAAPTPPPIDAIPEIKVTPQLAAEHGLTPEEYARIQKILGRDPNFTELGIFSVMWSEHCSYKSSRAHLKRLPTRAPQVLQGPGENAGVVDVGDGIAAVFKMESHNHPSYVEPFQGAATGVGGILRDIFTMGARPIAVLDSLRFGSITPDAVARAGSRRAQPPPGRRRRARHRLLRQLLRRAHRRRRSRLRAGLRRQSSGQRPGPGHRAEGQAFLRRAPAAQGNPVIYVGAKTGRDGIHGASLLASAEFTEESQQKRPNVQVGDPFLEKLLLEACLEAMATGAIVGIQDMGAAGLTSTFVRDGFARRRGHRDRSRARAAARNRHDALRNDAQRIAGAHAAGGRARPRARSPRRLPQVGTRRRRDRHGHLRRIAARAASRPHRRRNSRRRAGRARRPSTSARSRAPTPSAAPEQLVKLAPAGQRSHE